MSSVAELTSTLVRIASVNPDGEPGTSPENVGEKRCAEFLGEYLKELGAEVRFDEVLPDRPNVVGRFVSASAKKDRPRLLMAPHTDTVSVQGMTIEPFSGEIRDGKVWGRGSSDTKGPMASMLIAIKECRDILPLLSHEVTFAGLMSEETGQHGSKALAKKEKFDFVMVGEPTSLETVHKHKGSARLELRTVGKAAHSSTPERGENAIDPLLDALQFLREEITKAFEGKEDKVLGRPTFNIGVIRAGSKVNIVPDSGDARVDIRTIPGLDLTPVFDELRRKFPKVDLVANVSPPLDTDVSHPLIGKLIECGSRPVGAPWFCDAAAFGVLGTAGVAIGPGSIAQAHVVDEYISIADLEEGVQFFKKFLTSLKVS